jgi:hypothetical protein
MEFCLLAFTVCYVVQEIVEAESVGSVDGLQLPSYKVPVVLFEHFDFLILVLQIGDLENDHLFVFTNRPKTTTDHDDPDSLEQKRDVVVLNEQQWTVVAQSEVHI